MTQNHAMLSRQLTIFSSNLRCLCVALAPVGETSRDLGNGIARGIGDSPFGVPRETATRNMYSFSCCSHVQGITTRKQLKQYQNQNSSPLVTTTDLSCE